MKFTEKQPSVDHIGPGMEQELATPLHGWEKGRGAWGSVELVNNI